MQRPGPGPAGRALCGQDPAPPPAVQPRSMQAHHLRGPHGRQRSSGAALVIACAVRNQLNKAFQSARERNHEDDETRAQRAHRATARVPHCQARKLWNRWSACCRFRGLPSPAARALCSALEDGGAGPGPASLTNQQHGPALEGDQVRDPQPSRCSVRQPGALTVAGDTGEQPGSSTQLYERGCTGVPSPPRARLSVWVGGCPSSRTRSRTSAARGRAASPPQCPPR